MQAEVERVPTKDIADTVAADDHDLQPSLIPNRFEPGRRRLARRADAKAFARDHERFPTVHSLPEIGHQVTEGARLPACVEMVEALGDAVVRRRDLVGIDGVELLPRNLRVPEDERAASNQVAAIQQPLDWPDGRTD